MTGTEPGDEPAAADQPGRDDTRRRSDYRAWNWLLLIPVVVPLLTFLYNADEPRLFGFPLFYWLQVAFIVLGVAATTVVYQLGKRRR